MIKENVLEIKRLVSDLHCMGTYGMVELELTKIEDYVKELEGKVKNLTIPRVSQQRELLMAYRTMIEFDIKHEDFEESVDYFLKHKESYL